VAWIGVDLDGTLAEYHGWNDGEIGPPIPPMVERVKRWMAQEKDVRIFTARVSFGPHRDVIEQIQRIQKWCDRHLGNVLPITCQKDFACLVIYDDRAVQVVKNTGELVGQEHE